MGDVTDLSGQTAGPSAQPDAMLALPGPEAELTGAVQPGKGKDADKEPISYAQVVLRAKKRFAYIESVDGQNRRNQLEDTQFAWEKGAQWNPDVRKRRDSAKPPRPWFEFNQTGPYIKRVTNDQRQTKPAIKVRPAGGAATQQLADIRSGLIRGIEYNSQATDVYITALEHAATGGRGYFRIVSEYESYKSFNQVLRLQQIGNPLAVWLDPDARKPDKSDIQYGFVCEWIDKATYEAEWPDAPVSWESAAQDEAEVFVEGDKVCVADYYEVVEVEEQLLMLSDGRVLWRSEYDTAFAQSAQAPVAADGLGALPTLPPAIIQQGLRKRCRVDWYKLTARSEPLAKYDWRGTSVPLVCVVGDEIDIDGKRVYQGIIRRLRDAQMMYNYWFTLATERIALAPRAPWIGAAGQFEGHDEWDDANSENHPYLEWEFVKNDEGQWFMQAPTRTEPIPVDQGLITMLQICAQNIREITGQRDSVQPNPNVPWRAILAEMRKGDLATFHYGDNLARAIAVGGRILLELIPHYYDSQRKEMLYGEDGTQQPVMLNQQNPQPDGSMKVLNDMQQGDYDVVADVAPSYATQRMEAVADMKDFMSAMGPETAALIGDLFARAADWPGDTGEQVAARLFAMLPPQVQMASAQAGNNQDPRVSALQQALQNMQAQFKQAAQAMQQQLAASADAVKKLQGEKLVMQAQLADRRMQYMGRVKEQELKRDTAEMTAAVTHSGDVLGYLADLHSNVVKLMDMFTVPPEGAAAATESGLVAADATATPQPGNGLGG